MRKCFGKAADKRRRSTFEDLFDDALDTADILEFLEMKDFLCYYA